MMLKEVQLLKKVRWPPECADFKTTIKMLSLRVNQTQVSTMSVLFSLPARLQNCTLGLKTL